MFNLTQASPSQTWTSWEVVFQTRVPTVLPDVGSSVSVKFFNAILALTLSAVTEPPTLTFPWKLAPPLGNDTFPFSARFVISST